MTFVVFSLLLTASVTNANIDTDTDNAPELIEVSGRALDTIGEVLAGSSGTVGYEDLKNRPISRVGEILEVVPGLVATQHSGTGKANQFFLRGFNLDHGTDFATTIDGVPLNMRSHGHGQGYTDLNILIPELVERVDFEKGPYHADVGDFATAGNARIRTYNRLNGGNGLARVTHGSYGYGRALLAGSFDLFDNVQVLAAVEEERFDGPFEVPEDFKKQNGLFNVSGQTSELDWRINLSGYEANWRATDQIPLRLVEAGELDLFGSIDPDLGGSTERYSASAEISGWGARVSGYFVDYDFQLFSNFTYFLNEPFFFFSQLPPEKRSLNAVTAAHAQPQRGDEIEQVDRRQVYGGDLSYVFALGQQVDLELGAAYRHDDISEVGLHGTASRVRHTLVRDDVVSSTSYSGYAIARGDFGRLRLEAGLRSDTLDVEVTAARPKNSGEARETIWSPSASLAYRLSDRVELYANYGEGFHSNDARGATITIEPLTRIPAEQVPLLAKSRGAELGVRYETSSLKTAFVGFWLNLDSELVYVGDAGTVEAQGGSRRFGFEASAFWQMNEWANVFVNYALTRARFRGEQEDRIPNAVPSVLSAGLKLEPIAGITSNLILRHVGSAPLNEDGSVTSNTTTTLNWGGFYEHGRLRFGVEVLNLLNSRASDISYFFESRLENERNPVADVHAHPLVPRQVRVSIGLII
ncbi:MAG: TonB-dependent receptor [Kordiimonadaceae bacterium]|nr:TonB-dependent receptor [Kordiimonadaceae bacterium]MBO6567826.1 TonB-dependent receptor [Kordiimonadaceae bacterium]MBO6964444.1 TonB-dependent receptor [Kordiimonadaceae bacterium]